MPSVCTEDARIVDVTTRSFGLNSPAVSVGGEDDEDQGRKLCYLPSFSRTYSLWYKGHYISITRSQSNDGYYGSTRESLQIESVFTHVPREPYTHVPIAAFLLGTTPSSTSFSCRPRRLIVMRKSTSSLSTFQRGVPNH